MVDGSPLLSRQVWQGTIGVDSALTHQTTASTQACMQIIPNVQHH